MNLSHDYNEVIEHRSESDGAEEHLSVRLIGWRWEEVKYNLTVMGFVLVSGLAKLGFHRAHFLSSKVPESCLLILLGAVFGVLIYSFSKHECSGHLSCMGESQLVFPKFTSDLFFLYLLPPIILEAAYCLHNKHFFDNIRSILLFAVIGTIINFLLIGGLLNLVQIHAWMSSDLTTIQIFLFSSLISAVDPVAVLSIFAEVGVNPDLYFLVFGESLLNDGVAVVLYNMMSVFAGMESKGLPVTYGDILLGIGSFFTVAFGGLAIGILYGLLTALVTRFTSGVRVVEPLALLGGAYIAYITAELFHWSGIISLIGCGITQAHYAFKNISTESLTTVNYFIKMLSSTSDCIIFLYLGMAFFDTHVWNTGFVCWTVLLCLLVRFVTIYCLSFLVNMCCKSIKPICFKEQFLMAYGGLRGAVGFSLVITISQSHVPAAQMFVTTTLAMVMFTVFLQGSTIKFIVNFLHIDRKTDENITLTEEVNNKLLEHVMTGIEVISGKHGHFYKQNLFNQLDKNYLKKWFCVKNYDHHMKRIYEEISLGDHFLHLYGPSLISNDELNKDSKHQQIGMINTAFGDDIEGDHTVDFLKANQDSDLQRDNPLPLKVISNTNSTTQSSLERPGQNVCRQSLTQALLHDPVNKLHQVYDKNLAKVGQSDIGRHLRRRRESAQFIREKIISQEGGRPRRQSTIAFTSEDSFPNCNMLENLQPREKMDVNILLEKHQDMRKKKSITNGGKISLQKDSITPSITINEVDETVRDLC